VDDLRSRYNLDAAFGSAVADAIVTHVGKGWTGAIVPSLDQPTAARPTLTFRLSDGRLIRASAPYPR
ncbi:MAG: hypothetical protein ABL993_10825, partial [Vicinamibacterales bacterium]